MRVYANVQCVSDTSQVIVAIDEIGITRKGKFARLTVLFPKFLTRHNSTAACPMATVNFCGVSLKKYVFFVPRCDFSPLPNASSLRCKNAEMEINRTEKDVGWVKS